MTHIDALSPKIMVCSEATPLKDSARFALVLLMFLSVLVLSAYFGFSQLMPGGDHPSSQDLWSTEWSAI